MIRGVVCEGKGEGKQFVAQEVSNGRRAPVARKAYSFNLGGREIRRKKVRRGMRRLGGKREGNGGRGPSYSKRVCRKGGFSKMC